MGMKMTTIAVRGRAFLLLLLVITTPACLAFQPCFVMRHNDIIPTTRRTVLLGAGLFGGMFGGSGNNDGSARASQLPAYGKMPSKGVTNEVVKMVNGIKHRRLGGSDIVVSEVGLGTQRWVSTDFNAPSQETCFEFMDTAILQGGVNLIDTAEQYPIPSDGRVQEGDTERVIGTWIKNRKVSRDKVVIATKITGGRNVTPKNILADCEGSLQRLQTDYIDVYQVRYFTLRDGVSLRPKVQLVVLFGAYCNSCIGRNGIHHNLIGVNPWRTILITIKVPIGEAWVDQHPLRTCVWPWKT